MKNMIIPLELEQDAVIKRDTDGKLWLQWEPTEIIDCTSEEIEHLPRKAISCSLTRAEAEELLTHFSRYYAEKATTFAASP